MYFTVFCLCETEAKVEPELMWAVYGPPLVYIALFPLPAGPPTPASTLWEG